MSLNINGATSKIAAKTDYSGMISQSLQSTSPVSKLTATVVSGNADSANFLGTSSMGSLTRTMIGASSGQSTLSDYAMIKNGSYGKLMKAYYAEVEESKDEKTTSDEKASSDKKTSTGKKTTTDKTATTNKTTTSDQKTSTRNSSYNDKGSAKNLSDEAVSRISEYI